MLSRECRENFQSSQIFVLTSKRYLRIIFLVGVITPAENPGCLQEHFLSHTRPIKYNPFGFWNMKRRQKGIQIFLIIAISFSILVSSTYCQYYILAATDFLSPDLNFEIYDQEILLAASQSELKSFGFSGGCNGLLLVACFFVQSFHPFSEVLSLNQKTLILRC